MSDDQWIVDGVAQFLRSPLWTTPIHNFIDENCVVFATQNDATSSFQEQSTQHLLLHKRFQELVDNLLTSYIEELGVPPEQVIQACQNSSSPDGAKFIEYVYALDKYVTFAVLMSKRNAELEREAMNQLNAMLRSASSASQPPAAASSPPRDAEADAAEQERIALEASIAASLAELEAARQKQAELEDAELQQALQLSMTLEEQRLERERELAEIEAEERRKALAASQREAEEHAAEQRRLAEQHEAAKRKLEAESEARKAEIHQTILEARTEVAEKAVAPAEPVSASPASSPAAAPAVAPAAQPALVATPAPAVEAAPVAAPRAEPAPVAAAPLPATQAAPQPTTNAPATTPAKEEVDPNPGKPGIQAKPVLPGLGAVKGRSGAAFGSFAKLPGIGAPGGAVKQVAPSFEELKAAVAAQNAAEGKGAPAQAPTQPEDEAAIKEKWRKQRELLQAAKKEERERELAQFKSGQAQTATGAATAPVGVSDAEFARQMARRFRADIIDETKKTASS